MGRVKPVLDTNVLIDYLSGRDEARAELTKYRTACISVVTWMEVLIGARSSDEELSLRTFLESFELIGLGVSVADYAVQIRREFRIKLPDAIVYGSARSIGAILITRNTKDFDPELPDIRVPYTI